MVKNISQTKDGVINFIVVYELSRRIMSSLSKGPVHSVKQKYKYERKK